MEMYWPIALIVLSNILYNVCAKQASGRADPLASLTVTYVVGALFSGALYFALNRGGNLPAEYRRLDWSAPVLGLAVVGLEAGSIFMYRAGWNVNTGQLVHSAILAVCLLFVGYLFYHEAITAAKLLGAALCLAGLYFITR